MVVNLDKFPTVTQLNEIDRVYFNDIGQGPVIDRDDLQGILRVLGGEPNAQDLLDFMPADLQTMTYPQFENRLREQFNLMLDQYEMPADDNGKLRLCYISLLKMRDRMRYSFDQARRHSRWTEPIFRVVCYALGVLWNPMPLATLTGSRGGGGRTASTLPQRTLTIIHPVTRQEHNIDIMSVNTITELEQQIHDNFNLIAGTYTLHYRLSPNAVNWSSLTTTPHLTSLKNRITGDVRVEIHMNE